MRWALRGRRQGQERQPQADRGQQLREPLSPYAAGLTDDPAMSWDRYLQKELGVEPDSECAPTGPAAAVPAPRPTPEGSQLGTLNLVARPSPGDGRTLGDARAAEEPGEGEPQQQDGEPSPVTIRRSEARPGGYVAIVRGESVELPDDACRCGTPACRSGWPKDAPPIRSDLEAR